MSSKYVFGPLTKEEYEGGFKHPVSLDENPLVDFVKQTLRFASPKEHDCLLEFIKILKTRAKLTLDISHAILEVSILNDGYEDIIKETFNTVLKIPNVQRMMKKTMKENDPKPEICVLLCALLENSKDSDEQSKIHNIGKRTKHSLIIHKILEAPKEKIFILDKCIESFKLEILIEVLNEIVDQASEQDITVVMNKYKVFMRSIIIACNYMSDSKPKAGFQQFLDVIYKFIKKGAWKDTLQWKGVVIFMDKCKSIVDLNMVKNLPDEIMQELCTQLKISHPTPD